MQPEDELTETVVTAVPERQPFWDYVDVLLFIGIGFAILLVSGVPVVLIAQAHGGLEAHALSVGAIVQAELYAAIYFALKIVFAVRYKQRSVFRSVGWRHSHFNLLVAGVSGIALALLIAVIASLLRTPEVPSPIDQFTKSDLALAFVAVLAVLAAPFFEEVMFRGFLQPLLSRTFGAAIGIVITAALFGALHLPEYQSVWQYGFFITLVGVALGILRYRTDSIIPSTVMHAGFNAMSVIALIAAKITHTHIK